MKKYKIIVKTGHSTIIEAEDKDDLYQKLSSPQRGVLPVRGKTMIPYTPGNVTDIIEIEEE